MHSDEKEREDKGEKLPIDARLLADAVIELNISRRSVGLYPREHPITRDSIARAYDFLQKLFELRPAITLGIAKDVLMVDDHVLDRRNPVFREFAVSLHQKGLAAVTFVSGLTADDLGGLHELLVDKELAPQAFVKTAQERGIRNIKFMPLDLSKFAFMEGQERSFDGDAELWETYVTGLVEGRLAGDDAEGVVLSVPPEQMAMYINETLIPERAPEVSYDRVITSYLRKHERVGIKPELFNRFLKFVESLTPELKQQFLSRTFSSPSLESQDIEDVLSELSTSDVDRVMKMLTDHASVIPESVRNLLGKLDATRSDMLSQATGGGTIIDDIDMDIDISSLIGEDHFKAFVTADYQADLKKMLAGPRRRTASLTATIVRECSEESLQGRLSELILELIDTESLERDDYLHFLTGISAMVTSFLETGRFRAISDIYNTVYAHTLTGQYPSEARSMLEYFFQARDFTERFVNAVKLWGRFDREGVGRIVRVQQRTLTGPLFDALATESDASVRRLLLQVLSGLGNDMLPEAERRLGDRRWYVLRNMLYLIREARGARLVQRVRKFARHEDPRVSMEAIRTLLQFGTPDALSYLRHHLRSSRADLREQAARLAGVHRCEAVVPELLELLRKRDLFGTDAPLRQTAVRALGEIGDPRAIPALEKVCSSRTLLNRSSTEALRVEIFRSLAHYPRPAVLPLLRRGLQSGSEEIRAICSLLSQDEGMTNAG